MPYEPSSSQCTAGRQPVEHGPDEQPEEHHQHGQRGPDQPGQQRDSGPGARRQPGRGRIVLQHGQTVEGGPRLRRRRPGPAPLTRSSVDRPRFSGKAALRRRARAPRRNGVVPSGEPYNRAMPRPQCSVFIAIQPGWVHRARGRIHRLARRRRPRRRGLRLRALLRRRRHAGRRAAHLRDRPRVPRVALRRQALRRARARAARGASRRDVPRGRRVARSPSGSARTGRDGSTSTAASVISQFLAAGPRRRPHDLRSSPCCSARAPACSARCRSDRWRSSRAAPSKAAWSSSATGGVDSGRAGAQHAAVRAQRPEPVAEQAREQADQAGDDQQRPADRVADAAGEARSRPTGSSPGSSDRCRRARRARGSRGRVSVSLSTRAAHDRRPRRSCRCSARLVGERPLAVAPEIADRASRSGVLDRRRAPPGPCSSATGLTPRSPAQAARSRPAGPRWRSGTRSPPPRLTASLTT